MSSLTSAKGPSTTRAILPSFMEIRLPSELGRRPSPPRRTPAWAISCMRLPMLTSNSCSGRTPASDSSLDLMIIMKLIVIVSFGGIRWTWMEWSALAVYDGLNLGREVLEGLDLADLDRVAVVGGAAAGPLDGFGLGLHVDDPVAAEHFLGLGEGAVGHFRLAAGKSDTGAFFGVVK